MKRNRYLILFIVIIFSCHNEEQICVYNQEVIDYYIEMACGVDNSDGHVPIIKWTDDMKIRLLGYPTEDDFSEVDKVIIGIKNLQYGINISVTEGQSYNVAIHFIPKNKFDSILNVNVNLIGNGIATCATTNNSIYEGTILINSDVIHIPARKYIIWHEVTHVLGFFKHSKYPNSVIAEAGGYTVGGYSKEDKLLIQMHYSSVIKPGMTAEEVEGLVCWK